MKVLGFIPAKRSSGKYSGIRRFLAMMFAVPIVQLWSFYRFAANFEVKNINVAFVDYDRSTYSQKLINKIASSGYFRIVGSTISYNDALELIEKKRRGHHAGNTARI
jgi:ABC-2 type transport system permease protein